MRYRCPTCGLGFESDFAGLVIDCPHTGTRYENDGRYKFRMVPETHAEQAQVCENGDLFTGDPGTALLAQPGAVAGTPRIRKGSTT